jgi:hypothetical protein
VTSKTSLFSAAAISAGLLVPLFVALSTAGAEGCTFPAFCRPGDIVAADLGLDPTNGELTVAFERNEVLRSRRFDASGNPLDQWRVQISRHCTAVAVNGRNREVFDASVARNAVNITGWRPDGTKIATWDTGFTGYASDMESQAWTSEIAVARYTGSELDIVALSRDATLLTTWSSGYDDPAGVVGQTADRTYYVGVGPAEGESGGRVARYDDVGTRTAEWQVPEQPVALAPGPNGDLYVATRTDAAHLGSLMVLSDLGTLRDSWPLDARPVDLEVSSEGVAYLLVLRGYGRALEILRVAPGGVRSGNWMAWMELQFPYVQ